jgi:hypothetical protein
LTFMALGKRQSISEFGTKGDTVALKLSSQLLQSDMPRKCIRTTLKGEAKKPQRAEQAEARPRWLSDRLN